MEARILKVLRPALNENATRYQGSGEDYIRRRFMFCTHHPVLLG